MSHKYDVDSLEALQATLAWSRMKRRAKRWALAVPVIALAFGIACIDASHQTVQKARHPVVWDPGCSKSI
jgi:hypothetical protein